MSSNLVCNEGECLSPYSPCQSTTPLEILAIIAVKSSNATFNDICRSIENMFYCDRIILAVLSTPISKVWGSVLRKQRPLPTGIVRWQFPSSRGTTWRNNGSSTRNGSRFQHHIRIFITENTKIHEVKLKMSFYNWLSDYKWFRQICRGLMSQCTRACANSTSNPSACRPRDMTSCSARGLVHSDNNPSRTGLNHLKMDDCAILSYDDVITYPCTVSIVGFANLCFTHRKKNTDIMVFQSWKVLYL